MSLFSVVWSHFGRPRGLLGRLAGRIMASRGSNLARNQWAVELLEVRPDDRVLEVGFGPGVAVELLAARATEGQVWGLDHSELMVRRATKRNQRDVETGRVKLVAASVLDPPRFEAPFDKALDINGVQFWSDPVQGLVNLRDCLESGGRMVVIHQPREPGATEADADEAGRKFGEMMRRAGFEPVLIEKKQMKPVPAVAVIGAKP
jgi:ubiquinone/menaquinone biosynthesis C-methylase UbiE